MFEYVGFDVSKEETAFCIKDGDGGIVAQGKVATEPEALFAALEEHCRCPRRMVMETGTMSAWLARELAKRGLAVEVIDARQAHAVMRLQHQKTDANDAALLADIARTGFCRPVAVKSEGACEVRMLLKTRAHLVRQRRCTENLIRGLLRSFGIRFAKGAVKLVERVRTALDERPELEEAIVPLLGMVTELRGKTARIDKVLRLRAKSDGACRVLMSFPGIGPITAQAYLSTIDDPGRFATSRAVGAYLGLTARRYQSGEMDWSGRISKHGDAMLRSLLYEAANSLLTVVRRAHPLKDWARRIRKRTSHKKACVALARKLAVILHRMLITGERFRWPQQETCATA